MQDSDLNRKKISQNCGRKKFYGAPFTTPALSIIVVDFVLQSAILPDGTGFLPMGDVCQL